MMASGTRWCLAMMPLRQTGTLYRDGVQFDKKTNEAIAFDGNAANLVVGGFEQAANIQGIMEEMAGCQDFPGQ